MWSCRYEIAEHFVLMVSIIMSSALLFNKLTPVGHRRPRDFIHSSYYYLDIIGCCLSFGAYKGRMLMASPISIKYL